MTYPRTYDFDFKLWLESRSPNFQSNAFSSPIYFTILWYLYLSKLLDTKGTEAEEMKEKGLRSREKQIACLFSLARKKSQKVSHHFF